MEQAKAEGFTIDTVAAGRPVGYKGLRFAPDEWCDCYTALEARLVQALRDLDDCNWLDADWSNSDELAAAKCSARELLKEPRP
jgi:hypothetical protein